MVEKLLSLVALVMACKQSASTCASARLDVEGPELKTAVFSDCGDKKARALTCVPSNASTASVATSRQAADPSMQCTCSVDGAAERTFATRELPSDPFELKARANASCGWALR